MATIEGIKFDIKLLREDMVLRGWNQLDLAVRAGMANTTVMRFMRGDNQTAKTAYKIANALGHPLSRYVHSNHKKVNHARQK